jgi:hypothetical protein
LVDLEGNMPVPGLKFAELDNERLRQVQALENELGVTLLALEPARLRLAALSDEQMARVQQLEERLNVILIAYQSQGK